MARQTIEAIAERKDDGSVELRCPGPAVVHLERIPGEVLVPGSALGTLGREERWYTLVLPEGVRGAVGELGFEDPWARCEHGRLLATLVPVRAGDEEAAGAGAGAAAEAAGWPVRAPSHGTFYRRPSPDSPPYVDVGQEVKRGDTLCLVEVMKCFSPVRFEPPQGHERGIVREVLATDGAEVKSGQVLFRIELA